jgi:hypothetical protein
MMGTVIVFKGYFPLRQAEQKVILCDCHLSPGKFVTVSQTLYIFTVDESLCSPGDADLVHTRQPGYLPKRVAVLEVHRHQQLVFAGKQTYPAAQKVDPVSIDILAR